MFAGDFLKSFISSFFLTCLNRRLQYTFKNLSAFFFFTANKSIEISLDMLLDFQTRSDTATDVLDYRKYNALELL